MAHLWANDTAPIEYLELILCRDVFHCTPSQLRAEDYRDVMAALQCLEVEARVNNKKAF